jgi:hypothetical protein
VPSGRDEIQTVAGAAAVGRTLETGGKEALQYWGAREGFGRLG